MSFKQRWQKAQAIGKEELIESGIKEPTSGASGVVGMMKPAVKKFQNWAERKGQERRQENEKRQAVRKAYTEEKFKARIHFAKKRARHEEKAKFAVFKKAHPTAMKAKPGLQGFMMSQQLPFQHERKETPVQERKEGKQGKKQGRNPMLDMFMP
jgi:hypothetical protein